FTRSKARLTDESFFRLTADHARSLLSTTCVACVISIRLSLQPCFLSSASIRTESPTRYSLLICWYSRSAITAPATRLGGPKSPPIASRAIFIGGKLCELKPLIAKRKCRGARRGEHSRFRSAAIHPRQSIWRQLSKLGGLYNNRTMGKQCARQSYCRIAGICLGAAH